ncbi:MAG TPA: hypothetical protein PK467_04420 [Candidatus Wallbacteria bacterium]|nr:MAG: hypothetical protein BWY32_02690 [bacterium ADurb.Bin243]HOD42794.1 hypothetical protein [Candidatus Wallbacteria bacterium]HOT75007.1 hypothetical protein [Candidatus Wallbacteria bacterium]HPG57940.1 hypothetical protein [Candidatus Wallbacteria bacterium]
MIKTRVSKKINIEQKLANVKATQAFEYHEMSSESEKRCLDILKGLTTSEHELKKILAEYNINKA